MSIRRDTISDVLNMQRQSSAISLCAQRLARELNISPDIAAAMLEPFWNELKDIGYTDEYLCELALQKISGGLSIGDQQRFGRLTPNPYYPPQVSRGPLPYLPLN